MGQKIRTWEEDNKGSGKTVIQKFNKIITLSKYNWLNSISLKFKQKKQHH